MATYSKKESWSLLGMGKSFNPLRSIIFCWKGIFHTTLMPGFSVKPGRYVSPSGQSILLYKYYTVVLNLTIYRQNTYNLLTIYENEFSKLYFLFFWNVRNWPKQAKIAKYCKFSGRIPPSKSSSQTKTIFFLSFTMT